MNDFLYISQSRRVKTAAQPSKYRQQWSSAEALHHWERQYTTKSTHYWILDSESSLVNEGWTLTRLGHPRSWHMFSMATLGFFRQGSLATAQWNDFMQEMRAPRTRNDDNNVDVHFLPSIRPKPVVKLNPGRRGQAVSACPASRA